MGNEAFALTDFQCTVADEVQQETLLQFPREMCSVVKNMAMHAAHSPLFLPTPLSELKEHPRPRRTETHGSCQGAR